MALVVLPKQLMVDGSGNPRSGAKAYFYQSGTTTPITVYTTSDYSVAHSNPVIANASGLFPSVYINPAVNPTYKLVVKDSADVEIYSEDNIPALGLTQADVGATLYPRTAAEIAVGVTPTNYAYPPGDVRRYGLVLDGVADNHARLTQIAALDLLFPTGTCFVSDHVTLTGRVIFLPGARVRPASGVWVKCTGEVLEPGGTSILDASAGGHILLTRAPQWSYGDATYAVVPVPSAPNEFATLQDAIDAVPRYIRHSITVTVADGTYPRLDVNDKHLVKDSPAEFFITGNTAAPQNVVIQGLFCRAITGYLAPKFDGVTFAGGLGETGGNESVVFVLGCHRVSFDRTIVDGAGVGVGGQADVGVLAYSSGVDLHRTQIHNCNSPTKTKHSGALSVMNQALQITGALFHRGSGHGYQTHTKMIGPTDAVASPCPDSASFAKGYYGGMALDEFLGFLHGPSFFLSSATTIEDYFVDIAGYTNASSGGVILVGAGGLRCQTSGGSVHLYLDRDNISASPSLVRPLFMLVNLKVTALPSGEAIYVGTGFAESGAGDFIGFRITSQGIWGVTKLAGTESLAQLVSGTPGTRRLGFLYAPQGNATIEPNPKDYVCFFDNGANQSVTVTMPAPPSDDPSMQRRFSVWCAQVSAPVDFTIGGYKYVKV